METNNTPLKAALILRQWYTAAKAVLTDTERLQLYDAICAHAFADGDIPHMSDKVAALWQLIAPALDDDRERYLAKCERNRQNATRSHSQPLAATGSHSLPISNTKPNTISNTKPNTKPSLSTPETEEREKFDCIGIFLARGALDPVGECKRFWQYYDALGWKNNKGADIVRKTSAAAMWRLQCDISANVELCKAWYNTFRAVPGTPWDIWRAFRGLAVVGSELHISFLASTALNEYLETNYRQCLNTLLSATNTETIVYHLTQC